MDSMYFQSSDTSDKVLTCVKVEREVYAIHTQRLKIWHVRRETK